MTAHSRSRGPVVAQMPDGVPHAHPVGAVRLPSPRATMGGQRLLPVQDVLGHHSSRALSVSFQRGSTMSLRRRARRPRGPPGRGSTAPRRRGSIWGSAPRFPPRRPRRPCPGRRSARRTSCPRGRPRRPRPRRAARLPRWPARLSSASRFSRSDLAVDSQALAPALSSVSWASASPSNSPMASYQPSGICSTASPVALGALPDAPHALLLDAGDLGDVLVVAEQGERLEDVGALGLLVGLLGVGAPRGLNDRLLVAVLHHGGERLHLQQAHGLNAGVAPALMR